MIDFLHFYRQVLFESSLVYFGKIFHRIQEMFPGKSIKSIVLHYYLWKKHRHRTSLVGRRVRFTTFTARTDL